MATNTYSASVMKTSANDSTWRTDTPNAYQGVWGNTTYNNKRIGYIEFSSSMGTTMSTSNISSITISMTATKSGFGENATKTVYFYKYNNIGSTPLQQLGTQIGSITGTGFYNGVKVITCSPTSNATLFNNLKSYLEAGNCVLMIYAPNDNGVLSGYSCSTNYVGFSAASLEITYTPKYTLTLEKGTGISSVSGGGSYASGTSVTVSATPSANYNFTNWTNSSGTVVSTSASYTFNLTTNTTLTANAGLNTYDIIYDANGGSGAPSKQTKIHGVNLTLSATKPTFVGHSFKNWNTKPDGSGDSYNAGAIFSTNATITLYAQWTIHKLTVIYNANGGIQGSGSSYTLPYTSTANYGTNYNGSDGLFNFSAFALTKLGYTADVWNTSANGTGYSIDQTTSYRAEALASACGKNLATGNVTLNFYPKWIAKQYQVTYDANGGAGSMSPSEVTYDTAFKTTANTFTREGYVFTGWNEKADGTGTAWGITSSDSGTAESGKTQIWTYTKNITLYAQWTPWTYSIKYFPNGGSGTAFTSSHTYGTQSVLTANKFTRDNYTFLGWSTSTTGAVVYQDGAIAPSNISSNGEQIKLYAIWSQDSPWSLSMVYININKNWKMV